MATYVEPVVDEIKSNDVELFAQSLTGKRVYDSSDQATERVEVFLMCWLNGLDYPNKHQHIATFYERMKGLFPIDGKLYRILSFKDATFHPSTIRSLAIASYTDDVEVAKDILDKREGWTRYIYATDAIGAFDFHQMLMRIQELTQSWDMETVIIDREWEQEKLYPFLPEHNRLVWSD